MKCLVVCVIVIISGISGGNSTPQGFFGGLLPTASPQGGSPPKGPFGIFTQGQQSAQNPVGGIISSLVETRDKIRNETKKRIQSLLNATIGNRNKVDPGASSEKPEEVANPHKGDKETLTEKPEKPLDNKEKEPVSSPEKPKQSENNVKKEHDILLEKLKQLESNDNIGTPEKPETQGNPPSKSTPLEATTISNDDVDKLIEDIFSSEDSPKKETPGEPGTGKEEVKEGSGNEKS